MCLCPLLGLFPLRRASAALLEVCFAHSPAVLEARDTFETCSVRKHKRKPGRTSLRYSGKTAGDPAKGRSQARQQTSGLLQQTEKCFEEMNPQRRKRQHGTFLGKSPAHIQVTEAGDHLRPHPSEHTSKPDRRSGGGGARFCRINME